MIVYEYFSFGGVIGVEVNRLVEFLKNIRDDRVREVIELLNKQIVENLGKVNYEVSYCMV